MTQPTEIPATSTDNDPDGETPGQHFSVTKLQFSPQNLAIVGYAQYFSDAVNLEVGEFSPDGSQVTNANLKVEPADAAHQDKNYGVIDGINTIQNNDIAIVKMTPAKSSLTGTLYLFFKKAGTGNFVPSYSYSYAFDGAVKPTNISETTDPSTITAPEGAKTLQLNQTGYIDPQWAGGDANIKIDNTGKIAGLDNPTYAGKTVTFTLKSGVDSTITHTFNIKIPSKSNPNGGGGNNGGGSGNTTNNNTSTNTGTNTNNGNSGNSAWNPSTPTTPNGTGLPNYAAVKGAAVYATKGIYMYSSVNFKKSQRIAAYPKVKRVNRPMFVVVGYENANNGALRYKVRDVNHGKKTAGKVGYITANRKYVVNAYYQTMPSNKKITVLTKGVHAYKSESLSGRAKTYKKGTRLTVKKIVKHNLTTRYQLSNGYYVTANKKFVIQGNY